MLIVHVSSTDPAGSMLNFVNAINRHTPHRSRAITTMRIPAYNFGQDIGPIMDAGGEIEALLEKADVIHLHKVAMDFRIEVTLPKNRLKKEFVVGDYIKKHRKKVVCHIHGHPYERENVKENGERLKALGYHVLTSTPDLEAMYRPILGDQVRYFPNCVPIHDVTYLPRATDAKLQCLVNGAPEERLMVFQSPTNTVLKNVSTVKEVVEKLGATLPLMFVYAWEMEHETALRHKRNSHIVFDHMEGYYGLSSLEALSMGKPTIAGLSDYTIERICAFFGCSAAEVPWWIARNRDQLEMCIKDLALNDDVRAEAGARSRGFMEKFWSDANVGQRLAAIYTAL